MKTTKLLALLTALVLALSCVGTVTFGATEEGLPETIYYRETFSGFNFSDGVTTNYEKLAGGTSGTWALGFGGPWAYAIWLVNDGKAVNGNYATCQTHYDPRYAMNFIVDRQDLKEDFTVDFSFNGLSTRPDDTADKGYASFDICMFDTASKPTDTVRDGYGKLITIPVGGQITVLNDATTEDAAVYTTQRDKWYDVRVKVKYDTTAPTYSLYIKENGAENYSLLAADVAFPSTGNYADGISVNGLLYQKANNAVLALDDIMIYKTEAQPCVVSLSAGLGGSLEFVTDGLSGTTASVAEGTEVTIKVTPDKGYAVTKVAVNGVEQSATDQITFAVTNDTIVTASFALPGVGTVLQNRTYEAGVDADCEIAEGETYVVKSANPNAGCWWSGTGFSYRAGSYGYTYLVKHDDASPKSGQYMQTKVQGGDEGMIFSTHTDQTYTDSFVYEFSFMSPEDDVVKGGVSEASTFNVYIYPETAKKDGRSREGKIATVSVERNIKVIDDTEEVEYTHFTTERDIWYDMRFVIDQSTEVPTYDLYMKETADSVWTKIAENVSFPKTADYSKGLGTWASIGLAQTGTNQYFVLNTDDIRTTTIPEMYAVDLAETENGTVSVSGASGDALVIPGTRVTVNVTPDEGYEIASITVNGADQPADASFNLTVNEDTVVTATFKEIPKVAPSIAQTATVEGSTYDGKPAVYAYSKLNAFTVESTANYGMYLWQGGIADKDSAPVVLPLYARVDEDTLAVAKPDAAFAIKVFGQVITAGNTYSMQPFVGDAASTAVEVTLESDEE